MPKKQNITSLGLVALSLLLVVACVFSALSTRVSATASGTTYITGRVTFISDAASPQAIFAVNATPGSLDTINLTQGIGNGQHASWSPDGTKVAFDTTRDSNSEIYIMNEDGSGLRRMTNNSATDSLPAWSPDGTKIAFTSDRTGGNNDIYTLDATGAAETSVVHLPGDSLNDYGPAWSPDGTKIAFSSLRTGNPDVIVMNADGSNPTNITNRAGGDSLPAWSPDGTKIAFTTDHFGGSEISTMDPDGSNEVRITNNSVNDYDSAWSPDGTKLAYTSVVSGNDEIFLMNSDGTGSATNLTNNSSANDQHPSWQKITFPLAVSNGDGTTTTTVPSNRNFALANYTVDDKEALVVNGTIRNVTVQSGGALKGTGTVNTVTVQSGGHVGPGHSPGCLNSGSVAMNSGSVLDEEIGGTTVCSGYDQLRVTGTVTINNIDLNATIYGGFIPQVGQSYTIIDNDGSDAVTGTFNGIAEGGSYYNQGVTYRVTYAGGSGNDVVLTITKVDVTKLPGAPNTGMKLIASQPFVLLLFSTTATLCLIFAASRIKTSRN